jgi:hypothetical protein
MTLLLATVGQGRFAELRKQFQGWRERRKVHLQAR